MSNNHLNYRIDLEDLLTFSEYHQRNSKAFQSNLRRQRFIFLGLFILLGIFTGISTFQVSTDTVTNIFMGSSFCLLCATPGLLYFAILPRLWYRRVRNSVEKAYTGSRNLTLLGEHELEFDESGLTTRNDYYETKYNWGAFEKWISTPTHIYVYNSAVSAIVIPKNKFTEGDLQAIESTLRAKVPAAS
jgi:hypothetical protein